MNKKTLIVEGGAMRGVFAAGVLDAFLETDYDPFNEYYGVSAGSTTLTAFLSRQYKRSYKIITDYSCRPEFINKKRGFLGGNLMDLDWLWEITLQELPLNSEELNKRVENFSIVTTKSETGEACYQKTDVSNIPQLIKASSALPFAYRGGVDFQGVNMVDGGVADPIPVEKAYEQGAREITVILSRPEGYTKKTSPLSPLMNRILNPTAALSQAMQKRVERYNRSLEFIKNPPADCQITALYPPEDFPVSRMTVDKEKLDIGYAMGHKTGVAYRNDRVRS